MLSPSPYQTPQMALPVRSQLAGFQPLLYANEQAAIPTAVEFKYQRFRLWDMDDAAKYCQLMQKILTPDRTGVGEYARHERYDTENNGIEVCLQWYEVFRDFDKLPENLKRRAAGQTFRRSAAVADGQATDSSEAAAGSTGPGSGSRSFTTSVPGARVVESTSATSFTDIELTDGDADLRPWQPPPG